jgi:hypothetical protein
VVVVEVGVWVVVAVVGRAAAVVVVVVGEAISRMVVGEVGLVARRVIRIALGESCDNERMRCWWGLVGMVAVVDALAVAVALAIWFKVWLAVAVSVGVAVVGWRVGGVVLAISEAASRMVVVRVGLVARRVIFHG